MKDLSVANFILGMDIKRDRATINIWLNQTKYIKTILKYFNMQDYKPMKVPIPVGSRLIVEQCPRTQEEIKDMAHVLYESVVGSLMYVMVCTRPNIAHEVGVLIRYISTPGKEHRIVVKRIFMYFCGTKDYAICYQGKYGDENEVNVHGFVDTDWN
jgi:hypothetical protein